VADAEALVPSSVSTQDTRFDGRCQLCSRLAGQVVGDVFLHHPDCAQTPTFDGGLPRCCHCGGRLYFEPTNSPMLSAADREAARHHRPNRY
jgi:hypothetical protein